MKIRETSAKIFADKYLNQILTKREEAIVKEVVAGKLETATTITRVMPTIVASFEGIFIFLRYESKCIIWIILFS